jgi:hypothetical protein
LPYLRRCCGARSEMSVVVDLESPLRDLLARTQQLRTIMALIEDSSRNPGKVSLPARRKVDLSQLGGATSNTTNAMCIVFLAASFEEFFRELVGQCGVQLADSYASVPAETKLVAKGSYWEACLDSLRFSRRILTKDKPKALDTNAMAKAKYVLESALGFVMLDDGASIDGKMFYRHSNNYRPSVVDEIAARLGVTGIVRRASDSNRLKSHFGVSTVREVAPKLTAKLNSFYQTRNEIVHSLSAATGFGVEYVSDHIELIEAFAESLRAVLQKHIAHWAPVAA